MIDFFMCGSFMKYLVHCNVNFVEDIGYLDKEGRDRIKNLNNKH